MPPACCAWEDGPLTHTRGQATTHSSSACQIQLNATPCLHLLCAAAICAPGYGGPACARCSPLSYSSGGNTLNIKHDCQPCPTGYSTEGSAVRQVIYQCYSEPHPGAALCIASRRRGSPASHPRTLRTLLRCGRECLSAFVCPAMVPAALDVCHVR